MADVQIRDMERVDNQGPLREHYTARLVCEGDSFDVSSEHGAWEMIVDGNIRHVRPEVAMRLQEKRKKMIKQLNKEDDEND